MVGILFIFLLLLTVFALISETPSKSRKLSWKNLVKAEKRATTAEDQANEAKVVARGRAALAEVAQDGNDRFRALLFDAVAQLEKDVRDREPHAGSCLVSLQHL